MQRLVQHAQTTFGRLDIMICNAGFGFYGTVEQTPTRDDDARMMDVNFMGTFYGARAALPLFRAQGHGHLIVDLVDRRPARHRADERIQRDEGGAGRVSSSRCGPSSAARGIAVSVVYPVSTETEFRSAMERDYGYSVSGLGPKQSMDDVARAVVACVQAAACRGLPASRLARARRSSTRSRPASPIGRAEVRPASRGRVTAPDGAATGGFGRPMTQASRRPPRSHAPSATRAAAR